MAGPNEIQNGRLNRLLSAWLGIAGGVAPAPNVAAEFSPSIEIPYEPSWEFIQGNKLMTVVQEQASPGVGQFRFYELGNPSNSGVIVTVQSVTVNVGAAMEVYCGILAGAAAGTGVLVWPRDSRMTNGAAVFSFNSAGAVTGAQWGRFVPLLTSVDLLEQTTWVVLPGSKFVVQAGTSNTALSAAVAWQERTFDPAELR